MHFGLFVWLILKLHVFAQSSTLIFHENVELNLPDGTLEQQSFFGASITTVGDINGDNVVDIAVSAPGIDGAVYIFFLTPSGSVASTQTLSFSGQDGMPVNLVSVASLGDMNQDNIPDLAIGVTSNRNVQILFAFLNPDGTVGSTISNEVPTETDSPFSMAQVGDIDDDLGMDFAVSVPNPSSFNPTVFLLFFNSTGDITSISTISQPPSFLLHGFGSSIAAIGDINDDSIPDIVVGAQSFNGIGAVFIYYLNRDGSVLGNLTITANTAGFNTELGSNDFFGSSLALLGDLNGDQVVEIGVGAERTNTREGAFYILYLNRGGTLNNFQRVAQNEGGFDVDLGFAEFGSSIASVGDLNGDGIGDLVVGAPQESEQRGQVYLLFGSRCGDGRLQAGEQCDDDNLSNGDGCDSFCQMEIQDEQGASAGVSVGALVGIGLAFICVVVCVILVLFAFLVRYVNRHPTLLKPNTTPEVVSLMSLNPAIPILNDVTFGEPLGSGNFGVVYRGDWQGTPVAIKSLSGSKVVELQNELAILSDLRHPNCLTFFGVCEHKAEQFIVTEFMNRGELLHELQQNPEISLHDLIFFGEQCALGMRFLHSKKILHRDLACRNLLISTSGTDYALKVSDFGLSRQVETYYSVSSAQIPIRWTAPEVFECGKALKESDLWSYGVVLWEIFSRGGIPYAGLSNQQVIEYVEEGKILSIPNDTPVFIENLMLKCWEYEPQDRLSFSHITDAFVSKTLESAENLLPKKEDKVKEIKIQLRKTEEQVRLLEAENRQLRSLLVHTQITPHQHSDSYISSQDNFSQ